MDEIKYILIVGDVLLRVTITPPDVLCICDEYSAILLEDDWLKLCDGDEAGMMETLGVKEAVDEADR